MRMKQPRNIVVSINICGSSGRDCLSGIFRFMNTGARWRLQLINDPQDILKDAAAQPDGIIAEFHQRFFSDGFLGRIDCPVIFTNYDNLPTQRPPLAEFLKLDDEEIGRQAFRHLSNLGSFGSLVFATDAPDTKWSKGREVGFKTCASENKRDVHTLVIPPTWSDPREAAAFAAKLSRLPKPIAIFSAWDMLSLRLLYILAEAKIPVPDKAVVLGVDNDEIFCRGSDPTLSSILPNHELLGFTAAKELQRLMKRGTPHDLTIPDSIRNILSRDSTRIMQPAEHIIRAAKSYITTHASENISPQDVVRHLGISRTLADRRFREFNGRSIGDEIARARVGEIKRQILSSKNTLTQIASGMGFSSSAALTRYFKRETGVTPTEWRDR